MKITRCRVPKCYRISAVTGERIAAHVGPLATNGLGTSILWPTVLVAVVKAESRSCRSLEDGKESLADIGNKLKTSTV